MLSIAFSLLGAWILSWFGFDNLIINGASELFHITLSSTTYYFIFAIIGIIKSILSAIPRGIKIDNLIKEK